MQFIMKYVVNISGTSNLSNDPNFFIGTGFMGEPFNTPEELKALLLKYATYEKNGKTVWREMIKLTFSLYKTIEAFKEEGNRQCKENGFVNLFSAASVFRKDPFRGIQLIFNPSGWSDPNGEVFHFVLIKGKEIIPKKGKLSEILKETGLYKEEA